VNSEAAARSDDQPPRPRRAIRIEDRRAGRTWTPSCPFPTVTLVAYMEGTHTRLSRTTIAVSQASAASRVAAQSQRAAVRSSQPRKGQRIR
jgi:hypothetical protein